ncbi:hypothetical protein [Treponema zioleckii]|uniref:hypothetical protein n=1 Tax=Treponema zioleckii TaxID=331680 RepID=UPI001F5B1836|nr:hypothetical protein [Treponema zioleckii]
MKKLNSDFRFNFNRFLFLLTLILLCLLSQNKAFSYMIKYKEDYYKLFHVHYQQAPDDCIENIYWLEKAAKADFVNPLYVDFKINDEKEWEKYRYLFMMHINLKLIEQHMRLGRIYDKQVAHFYDQPWTDLYIENLNKSLTCYKAGLAYWQEASLWAEKANTSKFRFLILTPIQNWEDERERIGNGELDYEKILNREIKRVQKVIADFEALKENKDAY